MMPFFMLHCLPGLSSLTRFGGTAPVSPRGRVLLNVGGSSPSLGHILTEDEQ